VLRSIAFAIAVSTFSCGTQHTPLLAPQRPTPREGAEDASATAIKIADAQVGALIFMDRTRFSSLAHLPEIYYFVRPLWHIAHIDPQEDVDRFLVAVERSSS